MLSAFRNRVKERPMLSLAALGGALALAASAALPWWHLIDAKEPVYVTGARLLVLLAALGVLVGWARARSGPGWLLAAGGAGILLPMLVVWTVLLGDARTMNDCFQQDVQAERLVAAITSADVNPQLAWTEARGVVARGQVYNDYTLVEGAEVVSFFSKPGWYLSLATGFFLLALAWVWDRESARRTLGRSLPALGIAAVLLVATFCGPKFLALRAWQHARAASMQGDDQAALANMQRAAQLDPRLGYDLLYHLDLGRLYGRVGRIDEADYWAYVGDLERAARSPLNAYDIYKAHVLPAGDSPTLEMRFSNLLLQVGADAFNKGRANEAVVYWKQAEAIDPHNLEVMYLLGLGYTKSGDYDRAIGWWRKLIDANESVGMFKYKYVAERVYHKPITARAWDNLAWCYSRKGESAIALKCAHNAIQQGGTPTDFLD